MDNRVANLRAVNFGPCKACGDALLMVKVRELNGRLVAACIKCDVVRPPDNGGAGNE